MTDNKVTLDLDNPDDMQRLAVAFLNSYAGPMASDRMREALRTFLPEPPMPEPTGDVVALDCDGDPWRREEWREYGGWTRLVRNHGPVTVYVAAAERDAALTEAETLRAERVCECAYSGLVCQECKGILTARAEAAEAEAAELRDTFEARIESATARWISRARRAEAEHDRLARVVALREIVEFGNGFDLNPTMPAVSNAADAYLAWHEYLGRFDAGWKSRLRAALAPLDERGDR